MSRLRIVIVDAADSAAVYLLDAGGEAWRVWDSVGGELGRRNASMPPDPMATHRVFISRTGARRLFAFGPKDSHALVPRLLSGQLSAARPVAAAHDRENRSNKGREHAQAELDSALRRRH